MKLQKIPTHQDLTSLVKDEYNFIKGREINSLLELKETTC